MNKRTLLLTGALTLSGIGTLLVACTSAGAGATREISVGQESAYMKFSGNQLQRPEGYRKWVFVGLPLTPNDMNGGQAAFPEFHSVYIDPVSFAHYERSGDFPDGTILVKELINVGSKSAVSGKGYFMGDFIGLEATVKSAKHYPDEPGNWAYFSFTNPEGGKPSALAEAFPAASCNACHAASAEDDFVFTQYYPVLTAAKGQNQRKAQAKTPFTIDANGKLKRPEGYREWIFVGEPVTPNDMNDGKAPFPEFHSVYIDPASYAHLEETGEFRDGTILVKELLSVGSKSAVSGKGYFMGEFTGLEATIKSSKHFPNEPGNWAYFSFSNPEGELHPSAEAFPSASCNACHESSAKDDFVFTQYYPVLRAAMKENTQAAVAPSDQWSPSAKTPVKSVAGLPLGKQDLFQYLKSGKYKSFSAQETKTHPGRGPHTKVTAPVRVFYNDLMSKSLAAGNDEHPMGALAVKEMFSDAGTLSGWAVMAKTQSETDGGRGWFWYEVTSASDASEIAAMGNGVSGCASCHSFRDKDMVLSGYPLK